MGSKHSLLGREEPWKTLGLRIDRGQSRRHSQAEIAQAKAGEWKRSRTMANSA